MLKAFMQFERRRIFEILAVEDNPGEVHLLKDALAEFAIPHHLIVMENGERALQFLKREGIYANASRPDIILLDLNLPRLSGQEVLNVIKSDSTLSSIPVLVLTCSDSHKDVMEAYNHRANCYVCKPGNIDDYRAMLKSIECFWLTVAVLPDH